MSRASLADWNAKLLGRRETSRVSFCALGLERLEERTVFTVSPNNYVTLLSNPDNVPISDVALSGTVQPATMVTGSFYGTPLQAGLPGNGNVYPRVSHDNQDQTTSPANGAEKAVDLAEDYPAANLSSGGFFTTPPTSNALGLPTNQTPVAAIIDRLRTAPVNALIWQGSESPNTFPELSQTVVSDQASDPAISILLFSGNTTREVMASPWTAGSPTTRELNLLPILPATTGYDSALDAAFSSVQLSSHPAWSLTPSPSHFQLPTTTEVVQTASYTTENGVSVSESYTENLDHFIFGWQEPSAGRETREFDFPIVLNSELDASGSQLPGLVFESTPALSSINSGMRTNESTNSNSIDAQSTEALHYYRDGEGLSAKLEESDVIGSSEQTESSVNWRYVTWPTWAAACALFVVFYRRASVHWRNARNRALALASFNTRKRKEPN